MTSKIKVDNINKVSDDSNIIKKCGTTTTIGSGASNPIVVDGSAVTLGRCGGTVALASGATQTGFGRTGTVDWQTAIKTGDFTAVSGEGYFVNTTSNIITMTLPASPSVGDIVSVKDYAQTFDSNALTVGRNSQPIEGGAFDLVLTAEGSATTLVYGDATKGWQSVNSNEITNSIKFVSATGGTETTSGDFRIHTFTGPGTFTVSCGGNSAGSNTVDYLVVAGGAGGASSDHGGGGGAGGYRESSGAASGCYSRSPLGVCVSALPVTAQGYPITVGAGGAGGAAPASPGSGTCGNRGTPGANSIFSSITSTGGGGGGQQKCGSETGLPGGSGGGGTSGDAISAGGSGNTPPVSPPQGNDGGQGEASSPAYGAGGGGGATVAGTAGTNSAGGAGGNGATSSINTTPTARAGGGGGASLAGPAGAGGTGGGGAGSNGAGSPGTINTGGGGGGSERYPRSAGGNGGSGIVVIRYKFQ